MNSHRWEIEETYIGGYVYKGIRLCRGDHANDEPCQWEYFYHQAEVERLRDANDDLRKALHFLLYSNSTEAVERALSALAAGRPIPVTLGGGEPMDTSAVRDTHGILKL